MPKTEYQKPLPDLDGDFASSFDIAAPIGKSDRDLVVVMPPLESADAAHDQEEGAKEPSQAPALSGSGVDDRTDTADSLDSLCSTLMTSAQDNGLPVPFFANLIWQESHLQRNAVSRVGAQGIAQFMPQAAVEVGLLDPFDPREAIPASARLLRALREHFGNLGFAAAAYNAGARRVGEWLDRGRALPLQTRNYVLRITGRSVETWRKAPLDDSTLSFVRPLPCRGLPAFAELEREQMRVAQQIEETRQAQTPEQNAEPAARPHRRALRKVAKAEPAARRHPVKANPAPHEAAVARNGRRSREAAHRQHPPHEKRRVA